MKRAFTLLIVPAAVVTLAACGGNTDSGSMPGHSMSSSTTPATSLAGGLNDQDVMFAQAMIPHHQQAIEMAKLATSRASSPEVKQLATAIQGAQDPEIKQMTAWLNSWGTSAPSSGMHMGHDMGDGMMSEQDMTMLQGLSGTRFDKTFLTMMIKHHQGAITMAQAEQTSGKFSEAKTLAANIITAQSREITTMKGMLEKM